MFKNAIIYRYGAEWADAPALALLLSQERFSPCGATQAMSVGFMPPRTPNETWGPLAESVQHQIVAMFAIEKKTVPADALKKAVDAKCEVIEKETGRKPGKKERRDLKDDAMLELLPQAFPRRTLVPVWFDRKNQNVIIGSSSHTVIDEAVNALVRCEAVKTINPLQTNRGVQSWLTAMFCDDELEDPFWIGREFDLQGSGDEPETIRFRNVDPHGKDVEDRVRSGLLPKAARLEHASETHFTLTSGPMLKRIKFPEGNGDAFEEMDRFDAEIVIETGLMRRVIRDLVGQLGGEVEASHD